MDNTFMESNNTLYDMIEDRHAVFKLTLICILLILCYLVAKRYF